MFYLLPYVMRSMETELNGGGGGSLTGAALARLEGPSFFNFFQLRMQIFWNFKKSYKVANFSV